MATKIETTTLDHNGDGIPDEQRQSIFEFTDGKLFSRFDSGPNGYKSTLFEYDERGNNVRETIQADTDQDGHYEHTSLIDRSYDSENRLSVELELFPDFDGDGILGDYQTWRTFWYNEDGQIVSKEEDYFANGYQSPSDYRDEVWTYDDQGRIKSHIVDDPMMFNNVITREWSYKGEGWTIKEQNEYRFGDLRARIDESARLNPDGSLKTHTSWNDMSEYGHMQRVDTEFTWGDGYDSQLITFDVEGDWNPEAVKFVENWYNSDGNLTHTLISHDPEGDGGPLSGGFDSRDLLVKTWDGDHMVSETRDYGADGVIEYHLTSEWMIA